MRLVIYLITGLIFGLGLVISGMSNPQKVLNFLDITGNWDASLAFVMGGAIAVASPAYYYILKRHKPLLDTQFHLPQKTTLDKRLMLGAAIFGIGWGVVGLCPGPAFTALLLKPEALIYFLISLTIGSLFATFSSKFLGK